MTLDLYYALGLLIAATVLLLLALTPRRDLALVLQYVLPFLMLAVAIPSLLLEHLDVAVAALGLAVVTGVSAALWRWRLRPVSTPKLARSAGLEVEIDGTGRVVEGSVLAGTYDGRRLSEMGLPDLARLRRELAPDPAGQSLLKAYLDGRATRWSTHRNPDGDRRLGRAPAPGTMAEQQGDQVLGLCPGTAETEVGEAHRRFMQGMEPKARSAGFLYTRFAEAKNVFLRRH